MTNSDWEAVRHYILLASMRDIKQPVNRRELHAAWPDRPRAPRADGSVRA